jgi:16S rRNA (cytosine1402-N4)-methyltransferase
LKQETETAETLHKPVMATETVSFIEPGRCATVIDATLGLGGHSEAILNASPVVQVLGIDQDTEAIAHAGERLKKFGSRVSIVHSNFSEIKDVARSAGLKEVDAVIADLGVSSLQLDSDTRGFSFRFDAPLDMRMDQDSDGETAAELWSEGRSAAASATR